MYLNPCTFSLISTKIKIHQPQCILFSDQNAQISTTIRYTKRISGNHSALFNDSAMSMRLILILMTRSTMIENRITNRIEYR